VEKLQEAQATVYSGPRPSDDKLAALKAKTPAPVILHLDSISGGGHDSEQLGKALRDWLRCAFPPGEKQECFLLVWCCACVNV
jgi:hypothetical protein